MDELKLLNYAVFMIEDTFVVNVIVILRPAIFDIVFLFLPAGLPKRLRVFTIYFTQRPTLCICHSGAN